MSRERYQRGSLKKIGKTRKMWQARWHVWERQPDGSEERRPRKRILGPVSEINKGQAQEKLDAIIKAETSQITVRDVPADPIFADVWDRYAELKSASWGTSTRKTVQSIFVGGKKSKQPPVLQLIGGRRVRELTGDPLQELLNTMAARGDSTSKIKQARSYLSAALDYAHAERLIDTNPATRLELPTKLMRKPCERFLSLEEVRALLSAAHGREHLVLRIFINCGLRPGELFALKEDDLDLGGLRIDEALKEKERGADRIGDPKTEGSKAFVAVSPGLRQEIEMWIYARRQQKPYHAAASSTASDLLFPNEAGKTFRIGNYLKRVLKPLAEKAGIHDLTYQALRRTCATHFASEGGPKATQTQLRHSQLSMTGHYIKQIPAEVQAAVDAMDEKLCVGAETKHGLLQ
jgi:integrase